MTRQDGIAEIGRCTGGEGERERETWGGRERESGSERVGGIERERESERERDGRARWLLA